MMAFATVALSVSVAVITIDENGRAQNTNGQIILAQYLRAVPAGPTDAHHCVRVCVKARTMGDKAKPVCVAWKKVC
jgi:hypothetical protein